MRIHVLLIEDSDKDAALIVRELRRSGLDVVAERVDSAQALEYAMEARRWDIVLADHEMPSFDAFRALEIVRTRDRDVSYVVVSGMIGEELAVQAMRAGAQDYVMKDRLARLGPVVGRELIETEVRRESARAAESLRQSEARKAAIFEAALHAVITMDHEGRVVDFNSAAERIFGYTRDEAIGQEMARLIVPERLRAQHRAGLARFLATGAGPILGQRIEMPGLRKDGTEILVELSVVCLPGSPPTFTGFLGDITERKRAEDELRRWEYVFTNAAWGIGLASPDDRFIMVNRAFAALHGSRPEEWAGRPLVDMFAEESRGRVPELVREVQEKGHLVYESVHVRTDGSTFPVMTDVTAFKDEAGRVLFRAASFLDITTLKRTEQELRDMVRARDDFLQVAGHELRTPLTPLALHLDSLARSLATSGIEDRRLVERVASAIGQTHRLAQLVESLLDVSRITAGRVMLEVGPVDVAQLVCTVVERCRPEAQRAGSELNVRVDGPAEARWDRVRVDQILSNLVTNAIKYGQGKPIDVVARRVGGAESISVTDRGIGIDEEALDRIFGRFERAVSVRHFGGFGLGLFIARTFAEAHGGTIVAESRPGAGSTFTVTLPL